MELHVFKNGMVIMDGRRVVAKARLLGCGLWSLRIESGCWLDDAARRKKLPISHIKDSGIFDPSRMIVDTKAEARRALSSLILNVGE